MIPNKTEFLAECKRVQKEYFKDYTPTGMYYIDVERLQTMFAEYLPTNTKVQKGWAVFLRKNAYRGKHTHDHITGIYYLQAPAGSGILCFNNKAVIPHEDEFHLFPKEIEHNVTKHNSDIDRWSIAIEVGKTDGMTLEVITDRLPADAFSIVGNPVHVEEGAKWYW